VLKSTLWVLGFHIFIYFIYSSSEAWLGCPLYSKLIVAAPRDGTQVEESFWVVEDHHAHASSGSRCRYVKEEEENPDDLYCSSALVLPAQRGFFHRLIQVGLSRSLCSNQYPSQNTKSSAHCKVLHSFRSTFMTSEMNFAPSCRMHF